MLTEMNSAQSSETLSLSIFSFHRIWRHRLTCFLLTSLFIGTAQAGFLLDGLSSYQRTYDLHSIDGAVDYVLDHQLHLFSTLIAGGLAGAAVAYGVAWLLLRKHLGRSLFWYAHIIGIAVAVIGGAVFRILAMFIYAGEDAIYLAAASGASGFYLLVIPALIALSYIWMLKSPSILFGVSSIPPVVVEPLANPTIPISRQHAMALPFASPWKRLGAVLIDSILLLIAGALLGVLVGNVASVDTLTDERFERRMNGYGYLLAWLYYALMESSAKRATLGKIALGLTVTDLNGDRIGFWRATGRFFGRLISLVILLGGFVMAFFTQKRQTLHDMMSGCLVLDANAPTISATPRANSSAPASKKTPDQYLDRALAELSAGNYDKSLWFTVTTATNGDLDAARDEYARLRGSHLKSFDRALAEVSTDWYDKELWAKAMVTANGDTNAARNEYARLRVNYWQSRSSGKVVSPPRESSVAAATPSPSGSGATEDLPSLSPLNFAVDEDAIYAAISHELKSGALDEGLWTRLFAECDGDENRTKVAYIKQRAEKLISLEQIQRLRDEESIRIEQTRLESVALSGLREQMAAGFYSDENQQKLKSLSASYTAEMFFGKVRNNLLNDVEFLLRGNPLLVAVSNSDGNTPLHVSILERYVEMSQLLLQMGAPTYIENKNGDTPLNLARKKGRKRLVDLLTSSSA